MQRLRLGVKPCFCTPPPRLTAVGAPGDAGAELIGHAGPNEIMSLGCTISPLQVSSLSVRTSSTCRSAQSKQTDIPLDFIRTASFGAARDPRLPQGITVRVLVPDTNDCLHHQHPDLTT